MTKRSERAMPADKTDLMGNLNSLQPGDRALHGMLYPRIYPDPYDHEMHQAALRGEYPIQRTPFFKALGALVASGVIVGRLRVIPHAGQFGYDERDIEAMRDCARLYVASSGEDCRIADFTQSSVRLQKCLGRAPLVRRYMFGAINGNPQANFWHIQRSQPGGPTGQSDIMNYTDGAFDGHRFRSPVPPDEQAYIDFWEDTYANYAERLGP